MMDRTHQNHYIHSSGAEQTLEDMMACASVPSQNALPIIRFQQQPHSPRHEAENPHFSSRTTESRPPFLSSVVSSGLSPEEMHSEYSFRAIHRPSSLSSILDFSVHDGTTEPYPFRRSSNHTNISSNDSNSPQVIGNQGQGCGWESHTPNYSPVETTHNSPTTLISNSLYWEDRSRANHDEPQWPGNDTTSLQAPQEYQHHSSQMVHSPVSFDDQQSIRATSVDVYPSILFSQHTPSPDGHGHLSQGIPYSRKRPGSPSVPSPPESPGYSFSHSHSQLSPSDIAFPPTPTSSYGLYTDPADHYSRGGIPPTPPSRPSSVSGEVAVMTSHTLASTPRLRLPKHSRSAVSRRKPSTTGLRGSARQCSLSSMSGLEDQISFVNFTPNDATRILNGVAPSGSSKTKARREKEAKEKQRKLEEATIAAVRAVGGDPSQLPKVL